MDKLKYIKLKNQDGTYSESIPLGAEAQYVIMNDGESVECKINKTPYCYNNVASMKTDTKLKIGDLVMTLGYYEANDGGNGKYRIVGGSHTDNKGSYHKLNNNLFAELIIENNELNIKQFGAYGDNLHDDTQIFQNAINFMNDNGGTLYLSSGEYIISNTVIIDTLKDLDIKGMGFYATKIKHTSNNVCFWIRNLHNNLFRKVKFNNLCIDSTSTGTNVVQFMISDSYGNEINKILSLGATNGVCVKLYNYISWTEGTIINDIMIREAKYGITFERSQNESATDSFYNTKIYNLQHRYKSNGSYTIYLKASERPILVYQAEIRNVNVWFERAGNVILVSNNCTLTGYANIFVDGTGGIFDGSDNNILRVSTGGFARLKGSVFNSQYRLDNDIKFQQIVKETVVYDVTQSRQPIASFEGAKIYCGKTLETVETNDILYESGILTPFTSYRVTFSYEGYNGADKLDCIVDCTTVNFTPKIQGNKANSNISIQPVDDEPENAYRINKGQKFVIKALGETSNLRYNISIEQL